MVVTTEHSASEGKLAVENLGGSRVAHWFAALLAAVLAILMLRLVALQFNATDLFFDEAQYWFWGTELAFGYYSKPPLIGWIIAGTTGFCGTDPFCVRLASPLLHTVTALALFFAANALYGPRVGFWSGLVYATLPAVSLSSGIISTDVPLLTCYAVALFAFVMLLQRRELWWPALLLGIALGVGLNSKYAMAYFLLSALIYAVAVPQHRWLVSDGRFWTAVAIGLAMIAPNLIWNAQNGFATLSHTADNANWSGSLGNPIKALEFFGAQFGVFGPILFGGLMIITWRAFRDGVREADALLLCFAVPVLVIVTVQAFISRAHANWAAVSYVAATMLVTATMIRDLDWGWFRASFGLHSVVAVGIAVATAFAGTVQLPNGADPFARTLGWKETALIVRNVVDQENRSGNRVSAVIADGRALTAELIYYLRDTDLRVVTWRGDGAPSNHYQLVRPYRHEQHDPAIFVTSNRGIPESVARRFSEVVDLAEREVQPGLGKPRKVKFYQLSGYKPAP